MTAVLDAGPTTAGTSTAPTGRGLWLRVRGPLLSVLALVLISIGYAVLHGSGASGTLDPASYAPGGARAVATLLADRGVQVQVVGDLPTLEAGLEPGTTVLVALPDALTDSELHRLGSLTVPVVVLDATSTEVDAMGLPVTVQPADLAVREPACDLAAARVAGSALTGRQSYLAPGGGSVGCYATGAQATVLTLPARQVTLVGAPALLTNDRLGQDGNAALALDLLGRGDRVRWLLPDAARPLPGGRQSVSDLLPDAVLLGALQLVLAVVVLALWRARRLGRVVVEPLPVVVRAAEAIEGRGRLYRAAGARDAAADALRAGARDRLARRLGLPPEPDRRALVGTVAARAARDPAVVDTLLYGPPPPSDTALVQLADALDALSTSPAAEVAQP